MTIHTFGDSHSKFGWNEHLVTIHHIGAVLCHSIATENVARLNLRQWDDDIHDGDTVIFCFGEIDCRCHVYKQVVAQHRSYRDILDELCEGYLDALTTICRESGKKDLQIVVYNIVPPSRMEWVTQDTALPHVGSDEERRTYTEHLNQLLREGCRARGFGFFDIYDYYLGDDGFLCREKSDGSVHIAPSDFHDRCVIERIGSI